MNDPTYKADKIAQNPAWRLAWLLSEIGNDNAPIGWGRYIGAAETLLANGVGFVDQDIDRLRTQLAKRDRQLAEAREAWAEVKADWIPYDYAEPPEEDNVSREEWESDMSTAVRLDRALAEPGEKGSG